MLINTNICVLPRVLHFLKVNRFFIVLKGLTVLLCLDLIKKVIILLILHTIILHFYFLLKSVF